MKKIPLVLPVLLFQYFAAIAQSDYETQVYGSKTVAKNRTMVELFSIHPFPIDQSFNATVRITHGFTDCFEMGVYFFNEFEPDEGYEFSGGQIRAKIAVPEKYKWPFGAGLAMEYGNTLENGHWSNGSLEIRPIADKKWKKNYLSCNPVFRKMLDGSGASHGYVFSPNIKWSHDVSKKVALGIEYYGTSGSSPKIIILHDTWYELYGAIDIHANPNWEFNAGIGAAPTAVSPATIAKVIVAHRF